MTRKRRAAIETYAAIRTAKEPTLHRVVEMTIKAEKMDSEKLYAWLHGRGYAWKWGHWIAPRQ